MRQQVYDFIKTRLKGVKVIAHIDLWNEQMRFIEEEPPFALPAVFIEFLPIRWEVLTANEYEADLAFRLHVCTESPAAHWEAAVSAFELTDDILAALHDRGDYDIGIGRIIRTASATSSMFDEIMHNIETYECCVVHKV